MKNRDTIILVVLAHVGLVLIWLTMGGCSLNKQSKPEEDLDITGVEIPAEDELIIPDSELIITDSPSESVAAQPPVTTAGETEYVIKPGDTLWKISERYRISVKKIKARNNLQNDMIRSGEVLIIPLSSDYEATPPAPSVEKPIEKPVEKIEVEKIELEPTSDVGIIEDETTETPSDDYIEHTVMAGDTIWKLARKYSTTETKIMELNNITDPRRIQAGDKLKIPKQ